jgi:nucleoside-diphosphate-sugar epimerase
MAAGAEVHVLSRSRPPADIQHHAADLFDFDHTAAVVAEVRPTHLLHLAWVTTPGVYWTSSDNLQWIEASQHLVKVFADQGGHRAVLAGTCAEYDWNESTICHEFATPIRPSTVYGRCKNELRERIDKIAKLSFAWGRLFHLYGPGEHPARLVPSVALALLSGKPAECTAGTQIRDFLHVDDAADALVALLLSDVIGPINIASGEPVAVRTLVEHIAAKVGRSELVRMGIRPIPIGEPSFLVANVHRLREELGWRPRLSLAAGLANTVAWWRCRHAA